MGVRVVFPDMGKDPSVQLIEKTITENGTYDAITDGANGYSKVNVNVEGGGGSSDFSTAEVTVVNNHSRNAEIRMAFAESEYSSSDFLNYVDTNTTATFIAILYKGAASGTVDIVGGVDFNIEGEGDVEIDSLDFNVTGDCTITIS